MKKLAEKNTILFGVVSTIAIFALFALFEIIGYNLFASSFTLPQGLLLDSAIRVLFFIPTIFLLEYITKCNGFKFAFSAKGFIRGILAGIPLLLVIFTIIILFFNIAEINKEYIPEIPARILQQFTTGLFEESLFRGLLITGLIIKMGDTVKGRIIALFISALPFGLFHMLNMFAGEEVLDALIHGLVVILPGLGFAAVYIYSKNLLSCMFLHVIYDIAIHLKDGLIAEVTNETLLQITELSVNILLLAIIPLFAIIFTIKAKPFDIAEAPKAPQQE